MLILAAVFFELLGFMGVTQAILETIRDFGLTPGTMLIIVVFYLFLIHGDVLLMRVIPWFSYHRGNGV